MSKLQSNKILRHLSVYWELSKPDITFLLDISAEESILRRNPRDPPTSLPYEERVISLGQVLIVDFLK